MVIPFPVQTVFSIFFITFLPLYLRHGAFLAMAEDTVISVKVGVVLDSDTRFGKMGLSCMDMALTDFYSSHANYKTRLVLYPKNSMGDVVGAASAALDLIKNEEVEAIVGPQTSYQAGFLADIGKKSRVPIISFSSTSLSVSSLRNPYFFRATQNDSSQVKAISAIIKAFNWRRAVVIHQDDEYGIGVVAFIRGALRDINTRVTYHTAIPQSATDDKIAKELYKLMTMQTRVFIVHMFPELGARVFAVAREIGMMEKGYVWIITDGMTNFLSQIGDSAMESMNGVLGVRTHIPQTRELENFKLQWLRESHKISSSISDLNIFGLRAYDATFALAKAVEKIRTTKFGFKKPKVSGKSTDLETFGVSRNGPDLSKALSKEKFKGLAGEFNLVDGQLQSSTFEIINLNNKNVTVIGYWTPGNGLSQTLNSDSTETDISSNSSFSKLGSIKWPGGLISPNFPEGWAVPTNEKKLRIGIPVKSGVSRFVREIRDPTTNRTKMTGYSIDIFEAAIEALPYAVFYEYIRFADEKGAMAGSYEDMVKQVYLGVYDAVVGDVSIRGSRAKNVTFTLPYSESSVSMVVFLKDNKNKAWLFLKPLTWDLWVTSGCFFVFIGLVIWVLEHRINEDFRGPPSHEIGTSFWFAFSTMVLAQREKLESNLARFVVIVWLFVILILTQSYTASLTSLLTVRKLEPSFTDMNQLKDQKANVGYPNGSFVKDLLKAEGFDETGLVIYNNLAHCWELLSSGKIVAAFDEIPYLNVLTTAYCANCTIIGPLMRSRGFGFVFPKGSPLERDVSKAILDIMELGKLEEIGDKWFSRNISSPDPSRLVSTRLGLESFWGLFLIIGTVSSSALLVALVSFLHEHRHVLKLSSISVWKKLLLLLKIFDQRDLNAPTMRKNQQDENREVRDTGFESHPSPSCDSNYINGDVSPRDFEGFHGGQSDTPQLSPKH